MCERYQKLTTIKDELWYESLKSHKDVYVRMKGNSMIPLIEIGDKIILEPIIASHIKPGEIIVFKKREDLIVHRIIDRYYLNGRYIFTHKGDNSSKTGILKEDDIIGKVKKIIAPTGKIKSEDISWQEKNRILSFISFRSWELLESMYKIGKFLTIRKYLLRIFFIYLTIAIKKRKRFL
jgi:signal peptidase I